jgi:rRNA processing protein Krr1/Pno1
VIIGVGGQTIKLLEEQSQTTIVVHNDKVNAVGEKLVTIVGKPAQVHLAEHLFEIC